MNDNDNMFSSYETAFMMSTIHGLIRVLSILITFLFWFFLALAVVILQPQMLSLSKLSALTQGLGIVGLSPVLMTTLSWKMIEKTLAFYLQKYADNHTAWKNKNV